MTFIILYNNLIPISLIVTMEVVKFQQAQLINSDLVMYYAKTDTPALCRTSSLVEDLGQIEYVFSDKTGTLTCNELEFRCCSIGGTAYADEVDESQRDAGDDAEGKDTWRTFKDMHAILAGAGANSSLDVAALASANTTSSSSFSSSSPSATPSSPSSRTARCSTRPAAPTKPPSSPVQSSSGSNFACVRPS